MWPPGVSPVVVPILQPVLPSLLQQNCPRIHRTPPPVQGERMLSSALQGLRVLPAHLRRNGECRSGGQRPLGELLTGIQAAPDQSIDRDSRLLQHR